MSNDSWVELLTTAQGAGPALSSFTAAVSALPPQARHTIGPDQWQIGKALRVWAQIQISNVVTAQPTFTFEFRLGPTSNIVAFSTGAILTSTTAHTTLPIWLEIEMTCRAIGSAANLMGQAMINGRPFIDLGASADITTLGHPSLLAPETVPTVGANFDSNVANIADLFIACSVSNAGNAAQLQQYKLYSEN